MRLVLDDRQPVVAGGGGAGEHALADAVDDRLLQSIAAEAEEQHADAGPAIGRFVGVERALDARFDIAADDRGRVAGDDLPGGLGPARRLRGDDEPRRRHRKRLGEGVFDRDVVDGEHGRYLYGWTVRAVVSSEW